MRSIYRCGSARIALSFLVLASAQALLSASEALAASATWNGTTNSNWATGTNWSATPVPGSADTATFNNSGNGNTTIDLGAGITVLTTTFDTTGAAFYTIGAGGVSSQTLTLANNGTINLTNTVVQGQLINASLVLGSTGGTQTTTINNNSNSLVPLTLAGNISGSSGAGVKTLTVSGTGTSGATTISGAISNGGGGGTVALTKSGSGMLILTGSNSYTGTTTLSAGILSVAADANLGNSNPLTLSGGTLQVTGTAMNGFGTHTTTFTSGSTVNLDIANVGNTFTISQVLNQGAGGLRKFGAGTLVLTASNTFTGAANIIAGKLQISGPSGSISSISASPGIILNGGNLELVNAVGENTDRLGNSTTITSNGGTLKYTNATGTGNVYTESAGAVTMGAGQLNIVLTNNQNGGGGNAQTLTFSNLTQTGNATLTVSAPGGPNATTNIVKVTGKGTTTAGQTIGPWATVGTSPTNQTDYAVYSSDIILAANVASSAETTWTTSANSYTLAVGTALTGTRTITSLRYTGAADTLALGANNLETFGILNGGSGTLAITGSSGVLRQNGTAAANLYVNTGSGDISISAAIQNNTGNLTLVKTGSGTLTLSGINTHTRTIINNGTVLMSGGSLTSGSSALMYVGVDSNGGTFTQTGGSVTLTGNAFPAGVYVGAGASSGSQGATGTINFNGGSFITNDLTLASSDNVAGTLGGQSATVNVNGGAVALTRFIIGDDANTTTTVNINSGILTAGQLTDGGIRSGTTSSTFNLNGGVININGVGQNHTPNVSGTLNLNGGTLAGNVGVVAGTNTGLFNIVNVRDGGAIINTTVSVTFNTPLLHSTISGDASVDGGLTKFGAGGTVNLAGRNTYTGATNIKEGTLSLSTSGAILTTSGITLGPGAALSLNNNTTEGAIDRISNSGTTVSNGGTITYSNTAGSGIVYAENIGTVAVGGSQTNFVLGSNMTGGAGNTQTLNVTLNRTDRPTVTFAAPAASNVLSLNGSTNMIKVTGAVATPAGQIIGPWATVGTTALFQADYAVYDSNGNVVAANVTNSADTTWTDSTKTYTTALLGGNGGANVLSATTHNMAALRISPAFNNTGATTIAIPTGGNLNTYGLLLGSNQTGASVGTLTISQISGGTGALSTPTGGGDIYINTGSGAITISAPINDNGGAVSVIKTGTGNTGALGTLTLSSVISNYSGATVINAGSLVLNTAGALADINTASSIGKGSVVGSAADLVLNGGALQYSGAAAASTNRLFSVGTAGGQLDASAGATSTMSFVGTGAMGFAGQTGARTLTLAGSNVGAASGSNLSYSTVALQIGDNGDSTSIIKTGTGTWALTNVASTYTGPTTIINGALDAGTLANINTASSIGMGSAPGSAADLVINGGTLQYTNHFSAASTNRLFSVGTSSGNISSSSANNLTGTLSLTGTGAMGFNGQTGTRTLTLTGSNTGANSLATLIGDGGGATALTKSGTGTWILGNSGNTYTGVTTINQGVLSVSKLANGGLASSIGISTNAAANLVFNSNGAASTTSLSTLVTTLNSGPVLQYTGSGDSTDRLVTFTTGGNASRYTTFDSSGAGALTFSNTGSPVFTTANQRFTIVLSGSNAGNNTFAGIITNNGTSGVSVVKNGTGTWILSGNNTYSDAAGTASDFGTLVNQGTLVISGSPTAATLLKTQVNAGGTLKLDYSVNNTSKLSDTGVLTLAGGTVDLSGTAATAEVVGSTTLSPGASSVLQSTGTTVLRMNAITRQSGGTIDFAAASIADTDTNNTNSILGAWATIGGANWAKSVDAGANDTAITAYSAYTDIDALGSTIANGAATNVRLNTTAGSGNINLGVGTTTINTLLQNTTTAAIIDTSSSKTLATSGIMIGTGKASVTVGTGVGGTNGTLTAATVGGDLVLSNFNNSSTLIVNAVVGPNGAASTLTAGGNVTLNGINTYTGASYVNSGTLTIAGAGTLNSGTYNSVITIASGATFNYTSSANLTLGAATSGQGNFIWNPSSSATTLTLSANRGATPSILTVKNGAVAAIISNLGSGAASDLVLDGGTLVTRDGGGGQDQNSRLFTLGTGGGTIQIDTLVVPGNTTRSSAFTGTGAIAFTGSGPRTLKFESAITNVSSFTPAIGDGPGGATSIVMGGTAGANGIWALDGANSYTGTTTVNTGQLSIRKQQSVNGGVAYFTTANVSVASGAGLTVGVGAGPTYFDATSVATILDNAHLGASTSTTGLKTGAQFGLDTTAGDFTYSGALTNLSGGNVLNFTKHGLNTLTLSGNNSYTGTTTIYGNSSGGGTSTGTSILRAGSSTAFGSATTANIVFAPGNFGVLAKLQLFGNDITVIGINAPVSNWRDGRGGWTIESGSNDISGTGVDILTVNTANASTSTLNNAQSLNSGVALIQDGGARKLGITKNGAGTLEIGTSQSGATNTYTGGTIINAGTLKALSAGVFGGAGGTSGAIAFGAGSTGTLQLNGTNNTIGSLNTDSGTPGTTFVENGHASTAATLTVNNAVANTYAGTLRNGGAATFALSKTGAGTLTLTGNNAYTGVTTVNGGVLVLTGSNGSATGGITVNSGGIVQFNSVASINGTTRNVTVNSGGTVVFGPTFETGTNIPTALLNRIVAGSAGAIAADNYASTNFNFSTPGLTAASLGAVGSVSYTGTLTPQGTTYRLGGGGGTLTYTNALTGGGNALTITGPGTVILTSASNSYGGATTVSGGSLALGGSGVLGGGALTVSGGTLNLNGTTATVGAVTISSGTIQNGTVSGSSYAATGGTITASLTGSGTFTNTSGSTTLNANNGGFAGLINLNGGTLRAVDSRSLGANTVTIANGAVLSLLHDGTGTGLGNGKLESISYGNAVTLSGAAQTITIGQFTSSAGLLNAANKTLQLGALTVGNSALTVTSNNGFGLDFTGTTTITGANPTFTVGGGSNAPIVQGLTLSGKVTGTFSLVKNGAGTLVLTNSSNDFGIGAGGSLVNITAGLVSITSDAALGQALNQVALNGNNAGLQIDGNGITINHRINTSATTGVLDVTQGPTGGSVNVVTLAAALNGGAANAVAFQKNGNGILNISVDNTTNYSGLITVNAGAIRVSNAGALGLAANGTTVVNAVGSAVQINGVNTSEAFTLTGSGLNTGGALENFSGTNTLSGAISLGGAATIGSTSGIMNIIGGITGGQSLTFAGAGNINVTTVAIGAVTGITKIGAGTTDLNVASTSFVQTLVVNAGTFQMDGGGKLGNASSATVNQGATVVLDNSGTNTNSRLGGSTRTLALVGGSLIVKPLSAAPGTATVVESVGALTVGSGQSVITLTADTTADATPATVNQLNFAAASMATRVAGGTALIRGSRLGTAAGNEVATFTFTTLPTFIGVTTTGGTPTTQGILPYVIVDTTDNGTGSSFATTSGAGQILRPLNSGTEMVTNTFATANSNVLLTNAQTMGVVGGATTTINSLTMNNAASAVNITTGDILTLSSGGLLSTVSNSGISGGYLNTASNVELTTHALGNLSIGSVIGNAGGSFSGALTKAGAGNLTLTALNNYTGTTTINQGTLTLSAGDNTIATNKALVLNGGTLALGANNQYVGSITSTGTVDGAGGTVTGTGTLTTNLSANGTFAGNISGSINLLRASGNVASTLTLVSTNDTTGTLTLIGGDQPQSQPGNFGGISLKDDGRLTSVTAINIANGTLFIDNTGTKEVSNRVNDAVNITLDSGRISYLGRPQFNSIESLGDATHGITLNSGFNSILATPGGTGVNSAELTLSSLTRNVGATLRVDGTTLGQVGNSGRILVTAGLSGNLAPVNGVLPGVVSGQNGGTINLAGYVPGLGFGSFDAAGFPKYATGTLATAAPDANFSGGGAVAAGGQMINALNLTSSLTFANANDRLTLTSGMIVQSAGGSNLIGTAAIRGQLTSGLSTGELFYFKTNEGSGGTAGQNQISSVITDNGGTRVMLILTNFNRTNLTNQIFNLTANNTYTGGTIVSGGNQLLLNSGAPGDTPIAAAFDATKGLIIQNSQVTMQGNAGQIAASNIVTLNGGSQLDLIGNNTLAGIVFNSNGGLSGQGGTGTPTVTPNGILTITGNISSTPLNVAVVPIISGSTLELNNSTAHNITVDGGASASSLFHYQSGATVTGLSITSVIGSLTPASGGFTKLGTGVLSLGGANTFTGGLNINGGAVIAANASALGGAGNVVTVNNNAALWLNGNNPNSGAVITIGSTGGKIAMTADTNVDANIVLNGALTISLADPTLNNVDRTLNFNSNASNRFTISGTGSLTVSGNAQNNFTAAPKFLFFQQNLANNSYTGGTTIESGGRIKMGVAGTTATSNLGGPTGSLTVNTGGVLDLNGNSQVVGNFTGTGGSVTSGVAGTPNLMIGNGNTGGGNFAGVISNGSATSVSLTKVGTGTITLSGANTSTGATTVNGGTLRLDFNSAGAAVSNIISGSSALVLGGGALQVQGKATGTNTQAVASTTSNAFSTLVLMQNGATSLDVNLGAITFSGGAGINFTGATGTALGARYITTSSAGANDSQTRLGGGSLWNGTTWASIQDVSGVKYVVQWAGAFTDIYTGTGGGSIVVPNSGTAEVRILEGGPAGPNTLAAATSTINSLLMTAATTASIIKMNQNTANDTLVVGNGAGANGAIGVTSGAQGVTVGQTANQGFLTAGSTGASTLDLSTQNAAAAQGIVINSKITNNAGAGAVSVAAGGAGGTITLTGSNTYSGTTSVGGGSTLEIAGAGSLGNGAYAQAIVIGGASTLKINSSTNQALTGVISGSGALIKDGSGTLSFGTVSNTYTGGTVVNGGTLAIGNRVSGDFGIIRGTLTINNGAKASFGDSLGYADASTTVGVVNINGSTLEFQGASNGTFTGVTINMTGGLLSGTGSNGNGPGILDLFIGANYSAGSLNTLASTTTAEISAHVGFRSYAPVYTVADGAAATDLLVSGNLASFGSAFGLTKAGAGLMAVTSNNTNSTVHYGDNGFYTGYTGTTTISDGTFQLGNGGANGSLNPLSAIANNGTFAFNRTNTLTQGTDFNNVISGTGAVVQRGTGTTILNGINTYAGNTTVQAGILNAQNANALGTTAGGTTVTTGATLQIQGTVAIGAEALTLNGPGAAGQNGSLVNVSGTNTYDGLVTLGTTTTISSDAGSLALTNAGTITGATFSLTLTGSGSGSVAGIVGTTTGAVTKNGAGTWTLGGANTYSGQTTVKAGTLALASGGSFNNSTVIVVGDTGSSGTVLDLTAKATGFHILSGQTLKGIGSVSMAAGQTLTVDAGANLSPGNSIGTDAVVGNLALSGTSNFELGTTGASHASPGLSDRTNVSGSLTLGGTLNLIDNAGADGNGSFAPGSYKIFTYGTTLSGLFTTINNIGTTHATVFDGGAGTGTGQGVFLDAYRLASANAHTPEPATLGNFHVGDAASQLLSLTNNAASGGFSESLDASIGGATSGITASGSFTLLAAGATDSTSLNVGLDTSAAGAKSGTATILLNSDGTGTSGYGLTSIGSQTVNVSGTVYRLADPLAVTPVALDTIHRNGTFVAKGVSVSNNAANDGFSESLNASFGSLTGVSTNGGSISLLGPGSTNNSNLQVNLTASTATAGLKSGTASIALVSDGTGSSGLGTTNLPSQNVTVQGQVYSGLSVWNTNGNGNWGTLTGTGPDTFGINWGADQGSPGLDPGFFDTDTATFDNTVLVSGGSATVSLNGANPSLKAITFNTTGGGGYFIAQGSSGLLTLNNGASAATITDTSGSHSIGVDVALNSNLAVAVVTGGDTLTIAGILSGTARTLTKTGAGSLRLTKNNTYSGATTVSNGTLELDNLTSNNLIANSPTVTVSSGAILDATGLQAGKLILGVGQTLAGSGTILGDLVVNGTHAPGASPGIETVMGNYTLNGTLDAELEGSLAGIGYDQVLVTDASPRSVALGAGSVLNALFGGGSWSSPTDRLWIISNDTLGSLTGVFSNYATNGQLVTNYDGRNWNIYYHADFGANALSGGNDVVIAVANNVVVSSTPEPGTLTLALLGLIGLGLVARTLRRRRLAH